MIVPVILAGGSGTRLWPLSRKAYPKQFLALGSEQTMLQETLSRLSGITDVNPIVISNEEHRFLVAEQLRQIDIKGSILLEPEGKNTAPAIALAAIQALKNATDSTSPILLVLASDHVINDLDSFQKTVKALLPAVEEGKFGTLGIVPTEPATGYGYIKAGEPTGQNFVVDQFVEKPDLETAKSYLDSGNYYWNSGMFLIRADKYLEALADYQPEILSACQQAMITTESDLDFVRIDKEAFAKCPEDSIDYAVMEPLTAGDSSMVVVAPLDAGWNDVGSWSALWDVLGKDASNNAVMGSGDSVLSDTRNCLINTIEGRTLTTLGISDLIVVDTVDALLVAHKDSVQDVKNIVAELKNSGSNLHHQHRVVYRPWGKYDSIDFGERYQVKRITVNPGAKLSVQMHHHRAEHWVVVSGTAKVTNGEDTYLVAENESTYIPLGQVHALENPGKVELEMIEVQSGSYLGEDDIIRFEDKYGRA